MLFDSIPRGRVIRNAIAVASLLGLTMCENLDNIDISAAGKATVPKATLIETLLGNVAFTGFDKVDFSEQFKNQGVKDGDIDSVHIKTITFIVEAPQGGSFNFIKSIHLFAQAAGLPKIAIGSIDTVPQDVHQIDLVVDPMAELKPYVIAPSMQILSEVEGERPQEDTTVAAAVLLDVDIHIPGCN